LQTGDPSLRLQSSAEVKPITTTALFPDWPAVRECLISAQSDSYFAGDLMEAEGSKTDAFSRRYIGQRGVVVGAVEILDFARCNQTVLHSFQCQR
jgi:hypothetical protein